MAAAAAAAIMLSLSPLSAAPQCPNIEPVTNFGSSYIHLEYNVKEPGKCCSLCSARDDCEAWDWNIECLNN